MGRLAMLAVLCVGAAAAVVRAQLTDDFYDGCGCPQVDDIVRARVSAAMKAEARTPPCSASTSTTASST